jgi:hypothetical protein
VRNFKARKRPPPKIFSSFLSARAELCDLQDDGRHDWFEPSSVQSSPGPSFPFYNEEFSMIRFLTSLFVSGNAACGHDRPSRSAATALRRRCRLHVEELESRQLLSLSAAVVLPPAPALRAAPASTTQINLYWNSVAGASYLIDEWVSGAWVQIATLGNGNTSILITSLNPATTYYFDVAASNAAGIAWANYQSVTTSSINIVVDHPAAGASYSPVTGSLFGPGGPSYMDVRQGIVGDCWLLSSLAEVAVRAPADIRNMFTYDGTTVENGSLVGVYTVRLFDNNGLPRNIIVDTELPAGGTMYDRPVNGVLWVALAEKAYAQANGLGYVTSENMGSDSYSALEVGAPAWALHAITGNPTSAFSIDPVNIAAAWNAGKLIVLTATDPPSPYIVETHIYAVVGYDPTSSQPFKVFNPWGTNASGWALSTNHGQQVWGLFNASAAFLSQNFTAQTIVGGTEGQAKPRVTNRLASKMCHTFGLFPMRANPGHKGAEDAELRSVVLF